MCGILGGNKFKNDEQVKSGLKSMMHRGVDNNTIVKFENGFYLAHNRLTIQDISDDANQPMVSDDGRFHIVFNGELWKSSFDEHDHRLRAKYKFKTEKSDTELLLYFLIDNIEDLETALNDLEGMFVFALYDTEKEDLILGRDFVGRLPLYYHYDGEEIIFSSEVKGIQQSIGIPFYDRDFVKDLHRELIRLVKAGEIVYLKNDFLGTKMHVSRFFDFKPKPFDMNHPTGYYPNEEEFEEYDSEDLGMDYYVNGFRERLEFAVDDELISDYPLCTILSGGIDSTVITYLLAKHVPNLEAFVVSVKQERERKGDLHYARIAAEEFGIKLHEVIITKEDIEEYLPQAIWAVETDNWKQVSPAVAQLFLARAVADKGYRVAFSGDGADEIFAAYGEVQQWMWHNTYWWHRKRVNLMNSLHKNNLIRCNKIMMYGGIVELRSPFMNREVVDFGLRIPTRHRDDKDGGGGIMKWVMRKSFEGQISEELLMRKKKTFQVGCHSDFLKDQKDVIENHFKQLFVDCDVPSDYIRQFSTEIQEFSA